MKRVYKIAFATAMALGAPAMAAPMVLHPAAELRLATMPQNADAVAAHIRARLSLRGALWVDVEAKRLRDGKTSLGNVEGDARQAGGGLLIGAIPPGADIEELAFLVLMEAAKSADDDLRNVMDEVQAENAAKQSQRSSLQSARAAALSLEDEKNSLGDLSEQQSLRLQMAIDRRAKYIETISDILKEIGDTDQSIIKNLK